MDYILQYSVNIALESSMLLVLSILLVTCIWQRKNFTTTVPLISLLSFIMLALANQVVTYILAVCNIPINYGLLPVRIVYVLDFIFGYGITVAFYQYVEALVKDGYKNIGVTYTSKTSVKTAIIVWGVVSTLLYGILLFNPAILSIKNNELVFSVPAYIILQFMTKFAVVCTAVSIFKNKKVLNKSEAALSIIFLILISTFIIVDELCGLCISYVITSLFTFILYVRIDLHKGYLLEKQSKEITQWQTQIMLSQMQPHFLYNVLTTISSMCEMQNATEARDVVNRFADYFRTNLDSLGKEKTISFKKELEHIETYLWLEKLRFEDQLNICYNIGPTDFRLPSLAVQPIVENAVKHGILPKDEAGTLTITTDENENEYLIIIEDDGVGFDINENPSDNRTHIGIENVTKRLEVICGGHCDINSVIGKGTIVTIHIPKGVKV